MNIVLNDRASDFVGESSREYTPQGFLRVKGRVARSGIQRYYGYELGLKDKAFKVVNLYRPAEVVLSDKVCEMFDGVDVTNDHPKDWVDSKNFRKLTSGTVMGRAHRDESKPDFIVCDMLIKDEDTIKALESGKIQLSVGYRNTIEPKSGITEDGESYDAVVTSIDAVNHVALVSRARAGIEAKLLDSEVKMKTLKVGDKEVELNDEIASVISDHIDTLEAEKNELQSEIELSDKLQGELEEQISVLEKELSDARDAILSDEDIQEILKVAESTKETARVIAGEDFKCDSVDPLAIMTTALNDAGFGEEIKDKDEAFVRGYFASTAKVMQNATSSHNAISKALTDEKPKESDDHYRKMMERTSEAWKK